MLEVSTHLCEELLLLPLSELGDGALQVEARLLGDAGHVLGLGLNFAVLDVLLAVGDPSIFYQELFFWAWDVGPYR